MSARRNAHATQSRAWLSVEMAMVVREINQMAPTPSISGSRRRQQHITCAACPNPAARLLAVAQPFDVESHSTGAPRRDTPKRIFARAGSVLSATTCPRWTRFAVRSLCLVRQDGQPSTRLTRSLLRKSRRPQGDFCLLPPETSDALSGTTLQEFLASIPVVHKEHTLRFRI